MTYEQTLNNKDLASLLDEFKAKLVGINTHMPVTPSLHDDYRNLKYVTVNLTKEIRQHPEFTSLSESGKYHADFLVKWEEIESFTRTLGFEWYYDGRSPDECQESFRKEGREARALCATIEDVVVKKGVWWGRKEGEVKTSVREIPPRERQWLKWSIASLNLIDASMNRSC